MQKSKMFDARTLPITINRLIPEWHMIFNMLRSGQEVEPEKLDRIKYFGTCTIGEFRSRLGLPYDMAGCMMDDYCSGCHDLGIAFLHAVGLGSIDSIDILEKKLIEHAKNTHKVHHTRSGKVKGKEGNPNGF